MTSTWPISNRTPTDVYIIDALKAVVDLSEKQFWWSRFLIKLRDCKIFTEYFWIIYTWWDRFTTKHFPPLFAVLEKKIHFLFEISNQFISNSLCEKCQNTGLFQSVFSCIRTEYGDLRSKSLYSVRMQENIDQQ